MEERRRKSRTELSAYLNLKSLGSDEVRSVAIAVTNISTTGLGFNSSEKLEKGTMYEGQLILWTKEQIPIFFEVIRIKEENGYYNYGGTFVGMPDLFASRISIYQTVEEHTKKEGE